MELYLINTGNSYELYSKKKITALLEDTKEEKGQIKKIMGSSLVDKIKNAEDYVNNKILDKYPRIKKMSSYGPRMVRAYKDFMFGSHGQIFLDIINKKQQIDIYHSPSTNKELAKYAYLRLARREIVRQSCLFMLNLPIIAFTAIFPYPGPITPLIFLTFSLYSIKMAMSARKSKNYLTFKEHEGLGVLEQALAGKLDANSISDPALLEYYGKRKKPRK